MIFIPKQNVDQPNLMGYTLIMPSVSVGNVGQLAVDLLINNLPGHKIGLVHHPALYPVVGGDPYNPDSTDVTTSADIHVVPDLNVVILQIRSPLIKGERQSLLKKLCEWCGSVGIREVVMLSSCHAYERWTTTQLAGSQLRYLATRLPAPQLEALKSVGVAELEERTGEEGIKQRFLSGSGFVKQFLDTCELPVTVLFKFVDEGDNTLDAICLVNYLNSWKKLVQAKEPSWKIPFSWKNMFGGPAVTGIY